MKSTALGVACAFLAVVLVPLGAHAADDCQLEADPAPERGYVGRPCVTLTLPDAACVPFDTNPGWAHYGTACTFYLFLVPLANGEFRGTESEVDYAVLWAETNGRPGLQGYTHPDSDHAFLP